jgi:alkylated DNA repair dioxygenase AlkB
MLREIVPGIAIYDRYFADTELLLLPKLLSDIEAEQQHGTFGDRRVPFPRLTAWYGDSDAVYTYSGIRNVPKPWTPTLELLRRDLSGHFGVHLNSCLANVYRSGRDSIGWHSDSEPELRDLIVSVSLGATRTFFLREGRSGSPIAVPLEHGSVLTMTIGSQRRYQHAVQKEDVEGLRLNLTFRRVQSTTAQG